MNCIEYAVKIYSDGNKFWLKDGECHRDGDKPAIEYADGDKFWFKEGKCHRDNDKPAVVFADGTKEWHKNGKLHRDNDKPAIENANGDKFWYKEGKPYTPKTVIIKKLIKAFFLIIAVSLVLFLLNK